MLKECYKYGLVIISSIIVSSIVSVVALTSSISSYEVVYENNVSGLTSTVTKNAIDELNTKSNDILDSYIPKYNQIKSTLTSSTGTGNITGNPLYLNGHKASDTIYDSGWNLITDFESGFSNYGSSDTYKMRVRKIGNMVSLHGSFTLSSGEQILDDDPNSPVHAFTIPSGYRPTYPTYYVLKSSNTKNYMLSIETNGKAKISRVINGTGSSYADVLPPANLWFSVDVTYMLD